jgi:hypothetical protein
VTPSTVSVLVRIAWITLILIPVLIILGALLSGSDGGDSSQQSPQIASAPPAAPVIGGEAQKTAVPHHDRTGRATGQAHVISRSTSRLPHAGQPVDSGAEAPVVTTEPEPPQATRPKPPPAPRPKPPQAAPQIPAQSQPTVTQSPSATVPTTTTIANNNDGP